VRYFEKVVHAVSRILDVIARYALLMMMALVVVNIILRRTWIPILGTYEFVGFLMVIVIGFALAYCAVHKGHISIGFILERFSPRVQLITDIITGILAIALFAITTRQCCIYAGVLRDTGELSPTLHLVFYPILYALAACFLMLCLVLIVDLINTINKVIKL